MTYKLEKFEVGSSVLTLPLGNPNDPIGIGAARETLLTLPAGGGFDTAGGDTAWPLAGSIVRTGMMYADEVSFLEENYQRLLTFHGRRGKLYRTWMASGAQQWTYARLLRIGTPREPRNQLFLEVELELQLERPFWWSTLLTHHVAPLALATTSVPVVNPGSAPVLDAVLTVHATASAITSLTISVAGVSKVQFTGSITAGTNLVIDVGAGTVLKNGVNAFNDFGVVLADHHITEWLRLEAAATTTIVVQRTGGSNESWLAVDFTPAWR